MIDVEFEIAGSNLTEIVARAREELLRLVGDDADLFAAMWERVTISVSSDERVRSPHGDATVRWRGVVKIPAPPVPRPFPREVDLR